MRLEGITEGSPNRKVIPSRGRPVGRVDNANLLGLVSPGIWALGQTQSLLLPERSFTAALSETIVASRGAVLPGGGRPAGRNGLENDDRSPVAALAALSRTPRFDQRMRPGVVTNCVS